jgi:gluconolactonase
VFTTIADRYMGKRFSSPNDAAWFGEELFFTDPPYGLPMQNDNDPLKETQVNGVYAVDSSGTVRIIIDSLTRPNGLAFFSDGSMLVANSDPGDPTWYRIKGTGKTTGTSAEVFYTVKGYDRSLKGLPDGLKIDNAKGIVYATGPGGIYFMNREGKLLGRFLLDNPASNCALSGDGKTLYITNDMFLLRLKLK